MRQYTQQQINYMSNRHASSNHAETILSRGINDVLAVGINVNQMLITGSDNIVQKLSMNPEYPSVLLPSQYRPLDIHMVDGDWGESIHAPAYKFNVTQRPYRFNIFASKVGGGPPRLTSNVNTTMPQKRQNAVEEY
jgi:hypothetical protein